MSDAASVRMEELLARLRSELVAAGAVDADDLVAEFRSMLRDAAEDGPEALTAEMARLGDPAEIARGIVAERGAGEQPGLPTGIWWRLGIAAPVDIVIGLAMPLAAAVPLWVVAAGVPNEVLATVVVAVLGAASLAWPFFIWRPWRRGGRSLSPGMSLTGLAVVRTPGSWRLVRVSELAVLGVAPRRRLLASIAITLVALVLLAASSVLWLDLGSAALAQAAISAEYNGKSPGGGTPLATQLQSVTTQVYVGLMDTDGASMVTSLAYVTPEVDLQPLWERIKKLGIRAVRISAAQQVAPGVFSYRVDEYDSLDSSDARLVGSSTFMVGLRQWKRAEGTGADWAVIQIDAGVTP